jgi:hypothetical protein
VSAPLELVERFQNYRKRIRQAIMMLALKCAIPLSEVFDILIGSRI